MFILLAAAFLFGLTTLKLIVVNLRSYATDNKLKINVKGSPIRNEKIVKLLRVTVENKLSFEPHLNLVCKKVENSMPLLEFRSLSQRKN